MKELFDQAGIQPATTWKSFLTTATNCWLQAITPLAMDTADGAWVSMLLMGAMVATSGDEGLEFMNTKYPTDYNIEPVVNAVAEMQKWYQNYTTLDAVGGAYENAANNFFSGNVAMICNGPWMIGDFSDTSKTPDGFDQNVGVAAYPGNFVYDAPIAGMFDTSGRSCPGGGGHRHGEVLHQPRVSAAGTGDAGHGPRRCLCGNH